MKFRVVLLEAFFEDAWRWRLMSSGNNKILAHSEWYVRKHDALHTAQELADQLGVILETDIDR